MQCNEKYMPQFSHALLQTNTVNIVIFLGDIFAKNRLNCSLRGLITMRILSPYQ